MATRDYLEWTQNDVASHLENLGLGSYSQAFIQNHINGEVLPHLTEVHLKELGIKSVGHRLTLMLFIKKLGKPESASKTPKRVVKHIEPTPTRSVHVNNSESDEGSSHSNVRQRTHHVDSDLPRSSSTDEESKGSAPLSSWEKKRRQMLLQRQQNMNATSHDSSDSYSKSKAGHRIQQPEMKFSTNEESGGVFGEPPKVAKKVSQPDYEDESPKDRFKKPNPNPFSREDDDDYVPPSRPKPKAVVKKSPAVPRGVQKAQGGGRGQSYQQASSTGTSERGDESDDDYYAAPPVSKNVFGQRASTVSRDDERESDPYPKSDESSDDGYASKPTRTYSNNRTTSRPPSVPAPAEEDDDGSRVPCSYCGRRFAPDRVEKHEIVCMRSASKKPKVFDSRKMRLNGTEAAQYARSIATDEPKKKPTSASGVPKFKQEHEKLVATLRAARQYTEYEKDKAAGKKVGPPPKLAPAFEEENDDRVSCPHCGRKFAKEAAEKHIPVCERMNARGGRGRMNTTMKGGRR